MADGRSGRTAFTRRVVAATVAACGVAASPTASALESPDWRRLANIPDTSGFAGSFAGIAGGRLIVAGGANFPDRPPWEGGRKEWHDRVFVLDEADGDWRPLGRLPRPLGYGGSVTTPTGVAFIGGSDAEAHHAESFELRLEGDRLVVVPLPPLPRPLANHAAALVGHTIYAVGGSGSPAATEASAAVWRLDLDQPELGWQVVDPVPGPGRILPAVGVAGDRLVVAGGAALSADEAGKPVRSWLRDAHALRPGAAWEPLADLPRAAVAAPCPLPHDAAGRPLILGGDDGTQAGGSPATHRGFSLEILALAADGGWEPAGLLSEGLVTTAAVEWNGRVVIPGGEVRPGVRSNRVWMR